MDSKNWLSNRIHSSSPHQEKIWTREVNDLTEEFNEKYAKLPFLQEMRVLSARIVKKSGCSVLAVDWLMNERGFYFNEMSTAETGMTTLPEEIRIRVFNHLANIVHHYYE